MMSATSGTEISYMQIVNANLSGKLWLWETVGISQQIVELSGQLHQTPTSESGLIFQLLDGPNDKPWTSALPRLN